MQSPHKRHDATPRGLGGGRRRQPGGRHRPAAASLCRSGSPTPLLSCAVVPPHLPRRRRPPRAPCAARLTPRERGSCAATGTGLGLEPGPAAGRAFAFLRARLFPRERGLWAATETGRGSCTAAPRFPPQHARGIAGRLRWRARHLTAVAAAARCCGGPDRTRASRASPCAAATLPAALVGPHSHSSLWGLVLPRPASRPRRLARRCIAWCGFALHRSCGASLPVAGAVGCEAGSPVRPHPGAPVEPRSSSPGPSVARLDHLVAPRSPPPLWGASASPLRPCGPSLSWEVAGGLRPAQRGCSAYGLG